MSNKDVLDEAVERTVTGPELSGIIERAVSSALKKIDAKVLADKVEAKVEFAWQKMALKMLGFDNSWGREWEIDHCNGRHSDMSAMLRTKASAAADEFLKRAGDELAKMPLTQDVVKAMKKEYDEVFRGALRSLVKKRAEQDAEALVNKKMAEVLDKLSDLEAEAIDTIYKAMKNVKDPKVVAALQESLSALDSYSMKILDK